MWSKQPAEESRLLGFANFFSAKVGGHLSRLKLCLQHRICMRTFKAFGIPLFCSFIDCFFIGLDYVLIDHMMLQCRRSKKRFHASFPWAVEYGHGFLILGGRTFMCVVILFFCHVLFFVPISCSGAQFKWYKVSVREAFLNIHSITVTCLSSLYKKKIRKQMHNCV